MTHDDELIERAAKVLHAEWMPEESEFEQHSEDYREAFREAACKLVTAVRAYDAEQCDKLNAQLASTAPYRSGDLVYHAMTERCEVLCDADPKETTP